MPRFHTPALIVVLLSAWLGTSPTDAHTKKNAPSDKGPWVVRAYFEHDLSLNLLLRRAAPWKVDRQKKQLIIEINNTSEWQMMERDGFRLVVDKALTHETFAARPKIAGQTQGIPGFTCYRTVEETFATAEQLQTQYPNLVEWIDIGDSWRKTQNPTQGYDLNVLKLSNRNIPGPKPALFIQGGLHAREYVTAETVTRFAEFMLTGHTTDPDRTWILDHHQIYLLLQANPDGRKIAENASTQMQRKNRNANFCPSGSTTLGVDLNRNYLFDWGGLNSSPTPCSDLFRGPTAGSEPEVQAITSYVRSIFPDQRSEMPGIDLTSPISLDAQGIYIDVHSNAERNWFPWGNIDGVPAPNNTALQTLARKIAFYNGYLAEQSSAGGAIGGASDDYVFATLGVASYTIELGGSNFFPSCSYYESNIVNPAVQSLYFAARVVHAPYRLPAGPELIDANVSITGTNTLHITAIADDTRFGPSTAIEPRQSVQSASIFLTPPWLPGATPLGAMLPSDGMFNATQETLHYDLPVSMIPPGQTLVYLQATDALGNTGPVSAVWVNTIIFANSFE
jgi:carboxypeptidase T